MIYLFFLMAADFVFSNVNPLMGRYIFILTFPIVAIDEFKIFFREVRGVLERVQW